MRSALLLAVILAAGCSPDYGGTSFKCDATHPECPDGQVCRNNFCIDENAAGDDGGGDDGQVSTGHITCGSDGVCADGEFCCFDGPSAHCGPVCGSGETTAMCDDKEDCSSGSVCCHVGVFVTCQVAIACTSIYCADNADCTASKPNCCPDTGSPFNVCGSSTCP